MVQRQRIENLNYIIVTICSNCESDTLIWLDNREDSISIYLIFIWENRSAGPLMKAKDVSRSKVM